MTSVIRIKPYHYIHVLDNNTNVTRVEVGPQTFTRQEHEKVIFGPEEMIKVPPRHYVVLSNPVVRDEENHPVLDGHGNAKLRFGDEEVRFEDTINEPFPLFPGEIILGKISPLPLVSPNAALRLRAKRDIKGKDGSVRKAGDEWIFPGPATYYPKVEVEVLENIRATIVKDNQALKLRARKATKDKAGNARKAGEEWLVRESGAYLPEVDEEIVDKVEAIVLTEKKAVHLRAKRSFTDVYHKKRNAGEDWLVTIQDQSTHIPDVNEEVVGVVNITTLSNRQYCVVVDPVGKDGKPKLGAKELRKGECSFFLQPGERLELGIQNTYVLGEEEALLLRARQEYKESDTVIRKPGDRWMISGPTDYVPPVEVEIIERRKTIPLDDNEGIYVRDIKTGKVRSVYGESYLLQPHEELWEKELPPSVEELLSKAGIERLQVQSAPQPRDKTRVVTYRAPHNSAVQIYDYKVKKSRVVFGPDLVMLAPDEQFTVLTLSGSTPKKPGVIKSLALLLGPDFMTDQVTVETSDHARLSLKLSYNWTFRIDKEDPAHYDRIFQVPDFVGDACKTIASRVRGGVASSTFDNFHRNSADIIRTAVFGTDPDTKEHKKSLFFDSNLLEITNIDIQSVEPVDSRTRDSLQKSVQLAIEITTNSQEASARHEAQRVAQEAKGKLERQKIIDEAEAEKARMQLLSLVAQSATVEATGQATAEAKARAEAAQIEGEAAVEQARLKAKAAEIQAEAELAQVQQKQEAEVAHLKSLHELEVQKAREMAEIEAAKFKQIVSAIGADTIQSIAQAGPEMQAKLLKGLGLQSFMITDGHSPINLFNTANGLLGGLPAMN